MTGYEIIMSLLMLCFWIGFWLWFFTRNDLTGSSRSSNGASPLTGNGDGAFYCKQDPNKDSADVLSRIRSEGF